MKWSTSVKSSGFLHVFGVPMLLGALSAIGLVSALLGDGVWDLLSWTALGAPVAVIVRYVWLADSGNGASIARARGGDKKG
jgi:hypothetical protein